MWLAKKMQQAEGKKTHKWCWEKLSSNKKTKTQKNVKRKKMSCKKNWDTNWNEKSKTEI